MIPYFWWPEEIWFVLFLVAINVISLFMVAINYMVRVISGGQARDFGISGGHKYIWFVLFLVARNVSSLFQVARNMVCVISGGHEYDFVYFWGTEMGLCYAWWQGI